MRDKEYKITYDLVWTFEDREVDGLVKIIESSDAYNAVATLQYLISDAAKADIISVEEI